MSHEQAFKIITDGRGTHFDPDIVDAFLSIAEDFRAIERRFSDEH
jgi:putative two-component system response regulator